MIKIIKTISKAMFYCVIPIIFSLPSAHAADQPATDKAYHEWKVALSKAAPDPDAWLPTRRMIARRLLAAIDAGGKTPLSVAELRALRADFGSDYVADFNFPAQCRDEARTEKLYLWTWQRSASPAEEQFAWYKAAGCDITADIVTSFTKRYKIARDNKLSFPKLAQWAIMPDGAEKTALEGQMALKASALEAGPRIFEVASMLGSLSPRIDALRYDDIADITNAALWPFMEKELLLPRSRPGIFTGAADIELRGFMQENLRCVENGLSELTSKQPTTVEWFEDNFSAYKPLKADYLSSDPKAEDPRVPLLAFVFEFTRTDYFNSCRNDADVDIVSDKTREAMAATTLLPPVSGTLSAKLDQFRSCIEALPAVHKARRRQGVVDELGPIGCSRLAFSSASLDNFYAETINEQIERFRSAEKAKNKAAVCTAAREIKTWAAAILKAAEMYCRPDEPPFVGDVRKISVENAIRQNCPR